MKRKKIREIKQILRKMLVYRCEGCLADTGGCSCEEDLRNMAKKVLNLVNEL